MKLAPISDEEIDDMQFCHQDTRLGFQWLAFARAIIAARDKQWEEVLSKPQIPVNSK